MCAPLCKDLDRDECLVHLLNETQIFFPMKCVCLFNSISKLWYIFKIKSKLKVTIGLVHGKY